RDLIQLILGQTGLQSRSTPTPRHFDLFSASAPSGWGDNYGKFGDDNSSGGDLIQFNDANVSRKSSDFLQLILGGAAGSYTLDQAQDAPFAPEHQSRQEEAESNKWGSPRIEGSIVV